MAQLSLPIYSSEGKQPEELKLNSAVFDGKINLAAMHQALCAYQANARAGFASTKTRGEVRGGGRKPWRQKGTGRARAGSSRSPLWRGGGITFGPLPRDYGYNLPKKIKRLALQSSLNSKIKDKNLIIIDDFKIDSGKTKDAAKVLADLKLYPKNKKQQPSILLLLDTNTDNNLKALRNLGFLNQKLASDVNAYDLLSHQKVIITKSALEDVTSRIKKDK